MNRLGGLLVEAAPGERGLRGDSAKHKEVGEGLADKRKPSPAAREVCDIDHKEPPSKEKPREASTSAAFLT